MGGVRQQQAKLFQVFFCNEIRVTDGFTIMYNPVGCIIFKWTVLGLQTFRFGLNHSSYNVIASYKLPFHYYRSIPIVVGLHTFLWIAQKSNLIAIGCHDDCKNSRPPTPSLFNRGVNYISITKVQMKHSKHIYAMNTQSIQICAICAQCWFKSKPQGIIIQFL